MCLSLCKQWRGRHRSRQLTQEQQLVMAPAGADHLRTMVGLPVIVLSTVAHYAWAFLEICFQA
jgi:hypothetical protein